RELLHLGAPRPLVAEARRAAVDEERHARVMARRARAKGAHCAIPRARPFPSPRSLEVVAHENAVEGCVRETFGALLLRWQASHPPDPSLQRVSAGIAGEEPRHAALAWAAARWFEERVDEKTRARLGAARARAIRELRRSARALPFDAAVGLPTPAQRRA